MTRDGGAASHRALREVRRQLERHPVVVTARGFPADRYTEVVADLDGDQLDTPDPQLRVSWYAGDTADDRPEFTVHYTDDSGRDFGWHHEPNPHVEGWGQFQVREAPDASYTYRPDEFASTQPARVVWAVMDALVRRLDAD
ncbi:MAG: hypothetical protein ABEI75_05465 [Halobaculum sp.]